MTPFQRLSLENEEIMMSCMTNVLSSLKENYSKANSNILLEQIRKTNELLNPTKSNEPACPMEEDANVSNSELEGKK